MTLGPLVNVFGSFFPIWIFCLIAGILLTLGVRSVFVRVGLEGEVQPRVIVYPSLVALFACSMWLLWFRF